MALMAPLAQWALAFAVLGQAACRADAVIAGLRAGCNGTAHAGQRYDPNLPADAGKTTVECFSNTGGTCMVSECSAFRGATLCSWGVCWCQPGTCSGADGACYQKRNEVILSSFRLRNVRWPAFYLAVSAWSNRPIVSHDSMSEVSEFSLEKLPDGSLLIRSVMYPDYALSTRKKRVCSNSLVQLYRNSTRDEAALKESRDCTTTWNPVLVEIHAGQSAPSLAVRLFEVPDHEGAIMISSYDYPDHYHYAGHFYDSLGVYRGDPGEGGYWLADRPLNVQPEKFTGRRCSFDCSGSERNAPIVLAVMLGLLQLARAA